MTPTKPQDAGRALREAAREAMPRDDARERLAATIAERADAEGLLAVSYASMDSPVGRLLLAATPRGLVRVAFAVETPDDVLDELSARISPRLMEQPGRLDDARRQIERYFAGRLRGFELPLDWQLTRGFRRRVLRATAGVPYGETATYTQMAARAGNAKAQRAAGSALATNPLPLVVPCHRIVRMGGALGNYGGGPEMKELLLRHEGSL